VRQRQQSSGRTRGRGEPGGEAWADAGPTDHGELSRHGDRPPPRTAKARGSCRGSRRAGSERAVAGSQQQWRSTSLIAEERGMHAGRHAAALSLARSSAEPLPGAIFHASSASAWEDLSRSWRCRRCTLRQAATRCVALHFPRHTVNGIHCMPLSAIHHDMMVYIMVYAIHHYMIDFSFPS